MAVDSYTYGTVARLEALIGDVVDSRTFTASTTPTLTEAEGILDDIAAEIHAKLIERGYAVETSATLSTDLPRVHAFLRQVNTVGAAAMVLDTVGAEAVYPEDEQGVQTRSQRLHARYRRLMKLLEGQYLAEAGLTVDSKATSGLLAGSYQDSDGNINKPFFKRGMHDFSGSRSLTE